MMAGMLELVNQSKTLHEGELCTNEHKPGCRFTFSPVGERIVIECLKKYWTIPARERGNSREDECYKHTCSNLLCSVQKA